MRPGAPPDMQPRSPVHVCADGGELFPPHFSLHVPMPHTLYFPRAHGEDTSGPAPPSRVVRTFHVAGAADRGDGTCANGTWAAAADLAQTGEDDTGRTTQVYSEALC